MVLDRIRNINWFENCGVESSIVINTPKIHVESWIDAKEVYQHPDWEDVTLETSNKLTQFLHDNARSQFREWNNLVNASKVFMDNEVTPKIKEFEQELGLGQVFIDCVQWDILHAIMEDAYMSCNHNQTFFRDLLTIYESGHFPCGWSGEYPNGSLLVY